MRQPALVHVFSSIAACTMLAACNGGGGNSSGGSSGDSGGAAQGPSLQQRSDAATQTAKSNAACTSITPFYWEIGDQSGVLASGSGGDGSATPPGASTSMLIASATKWLFSTWAVEKRAGVLSAADIKFLNFRSGYTNFDSCSSSSTVSSCLAEAGDSGGTNGDHVAATDGGFYYSGGHMQVMANDMGLGPDANATLARDMQTILGADIDFGFSQPQLAGGARSSASAYGKFLRNILSAKYSHMHGLLGSNAVCTHPNSTDCPTALYSPVNQLVPGRTNTISEEQWHYSLGHWVEDDPTVGDGAFSSPGRFGFYPWIDKSKTYYGILTRYDAIHTGLFAPKQAAYITSAYCGRVIRKAWLDGAAQ